MPVVSLPSLPMPFDLFVFLCDTFLSLTLLCNEKKESVLSVRRLQ